MTNRTSLRLESQDEKARAERTQRKRKPNRTTTNGRRYPRGDAMPQPGNAHHNRPYIFGQEALF